MQIIKNSLKKIKRVLLISLIFLVSIIGLIKVLNSSGYLIKGVFMTYGYISSNHPFVFFTGEEAYIINDNDNNNLFSKSIKVPEHEDLIKNACPHGQDVYIIYRYEAIRYDISNETFSSLGTPDANNRYIRCFSNSENVILQRENGLEIIQDHEIISIPWPKDSTGANMLTLQDDFGGWFLINNRSGEIFKLSGKDWELKYTIPTSEIEDWPYITYLKFTSGYLWIRTSKGLQRISLNQSQKIVSNRVELILDFNEYKLSPNTQIVDVVEDSDGWIWIAAISDIYIFKDGELNILDAPPELSSIHQLVYDFENENFYVISDLFLIQFDKKEMSISYK